VIPIVENKREITLSDIMKTYSKITTVGGTSSHTAFSHIKNKITQDDVAAMANGDQINILIEITDGDTNDPNESLRNIRAIEAAGYHTGAIKFGYGVRLDKASDKPEDDAKAEHEAMERDTFDQMWNQGGRRKGIRINKPDEVTSAIYRILQKLIDEQLRQ